MAQLQNIGAANRDDAFYRYKMPTINTKTEGRGNGIKTNIVNMVGIAKALARPASYTTKYLGCELGAQSKFDENTGICLVNGAHESAKLIELFEKFIKKYVQCYECGNPETEITITKSKMITLKCAACGFVSDVDMRDKFTKVILKNPPEQKNGSKDKKAMRRAEKERLKEGEAADHKELKKDGKKKTTVPVPAKDVSSKATGGKNKANGGDHEVAVEDDDDDVQWQTDTSKEAQQQRIQEQLSAATAEMVMPFTVEAEQEKKQVKKEALSNYGNGVAACGQPAAVANVHDSLVSDIKSRLSKGFTPQQLQAFLGSSTGRTPKEKTDALFGALFEGRVSKGFGFAEEVGKKKKYLLAVVQDEASQVLLLGAIESFCINDANADVVKEVLPLALEVLYDADLLEEEVIVQWYGKGSAADSKSSPIWKNAKPFVEWLQNAESESGEE